MRSTQMVSTYIGIIEIHADRIVTSSDLGKKTHQYLLSSETYSYLQYVQRLFFNAEIWETVRIFQAHIHPFLSYFLLQGIVITTFFLFFVFCLVCSLVRAWSRSSRDSLVSLIATLYTVPFVLLVVSVWSSGRESVRCYV